MMALALLVAALFALATAFVLVRRDLRDRFLGESPVAWALAPLLPVAVLAAGLAADGRLSPLSGDGEGVAVFAEDLLVGAPRIPSDYREQPLKRRESESMLDPLVEISETITLSPQQAQELNEIRDLLFVPPGLVHPERAYSMGEVATRLKLPMSGFHWLVQWRGLVAWWSRVLGRIDPEHRRDAAASFIVDELASAPRLPELMGRIIHAAAGNRLALEVPPECPEGVLPDVVYRRNQRFWQIEYHDIDLPLVANGIGPDGVNAGRTFVDLVRAGCGEALSRIFAVAGEVLAAEQREGERYIATWQRILDGWRSRRMTLRLRVSNGGRDDVFLARGVRVGIGPAEGGDASVAFPGELGSVFRDRADRGEREGEEHVLVRRRGLVTVILDAELPEAALRLREEGRQYLRVALRVSSAAEDSVVLSSSLPFSREARELAERAIQAVPIRFPALPDRPAPAP